MDIDVTRSGLMSLIYGPQGTLDTSCQFKYIGRHGERAKDAVKTSTPSQSIRFRRKQSYSGGIKARRGMASTRRVRTPRCSHVAKDITKSVYLADRRKGWPTLDQLCKRDSEGFETCTKNKTRVKHLLWNVDKSPNPRSTVRFVDRVDTNEAPVSSVIATSYSTTQRSREKARRREGKEVANRRQKVEHYCDDGGGDTPPLQINDDGNKSSVKKTSYQRDVQSPTCSNWINLTTHSGACILSHSKEDEEAAPVEGDGAAIADDQVAGQCKYPCPTYHVELSMLSIL